MTAGNPVFSCTGGTFVPPRALESQTTGGWRLRPARGRVAKDVAAATEVVVHVQCLVRVAPSSIGSDHSRTSDQRTAARGTANGIDLLDLLISGESHRVHRGTDR